MSESKLCAICGAEMQATFDPFDNSRDGGLMCPIGGPESSPYHQKCRELAQAKEDIWNLAGSLGTRKRELMEALSDNAALRAQVESRWPKPDSSPDADIVPRLLAACTGQPAKIPWPHRLLHDAVDAIAALRAQLSGGCNRSHPHEGDCPFNGEQHLAVLRSNATLRAQLEEAKVKAEALARGFAILEAAHPEHPDLDHAASVYRRLKKAESERDALLREKAEREKPCVWTRDLSEKGEFQGFTAGCNAWGYEEMGKFCPDCGKRVEVKG